MDKITLTFSFVAKQLVGKLNYLTVTLLDIVITMSLVSQCLNSPHQDH